MKAIAETRNYRFRVIYDQAAGVSTYDPGEILPPDAHRKRPAHTQAVQSRSDEQPVATANANSVEHGAKHGGARFTLVSRRL